MLWSVNNGGGYPYPNGTDIASYVSASDFKLLDTNGDGSITQADNPYAPYYPVKHAVYLNCPGFGQAACLCMSTSMTMSCADLLMGATSVHSLHTSAIEWLEALQRPKIAH